MAYSYVTYDGNGSTTTFAISFNYLPETVVVSAEPKGIEVHLDGLRLISGYTVDTSLNQVNITTPPLTGVEVKILRVTPRGKADRLVDFADGTILNENQLDTSAIQLLYIAQEAFEQSSAGGGAVPNYLPYDPVQGWWDGIQEGSIREIQNIKTGLLDNSAATKVYVDNVAEWGISGVPQAFTFTNLTGLTNTFTLTGAPDVNENMLVVALSGALQVPGGDFTVSPGSVNSDLVFTTAPGASGSPLDLSVQNFGKMRFLDGLALTAGQVTTAALDQTVGSEAVTTETIRDEAVTNAKIGHRAVNYYQIANDNFSPAVASGTPRILRMWPGSTGLILDTIKTEYIENFTTDIRAQNRVNNFAPATAAWSNGGFGIGDLPATPFNGTYATSKSYVDTAIAAALTDSGLTKLLVYELNSNSSSWIYLQGWQSSAYKSYVIDIVGVNAAWSAFPSRLGLGFQVQTGGSTWHWGSADYESRWTCTGGGGTTPTGIGIAVGTQAGLGYADHAWATPSLSYLNFGAAHRAATAAQIQLVLPNNYSGASWNKGIVVKCQVGYAMPTHANVPGLASGTGSADFQNVVRFDGSTGTITGIRFLLWKTWATQAATQVGAGAKFIVYGRTY